MQADHSVVLSLFVLLLVGVLIIFAAPAERIYDEAHYFVNTSRLLEKGISLEFFRTMLGPTGPLHNLTQAAFSLVAGSSPMALRWHNLLIVIATLALAPLRKGAEPGEFGRAVALGLAIPGVWVVSMMALTEAPSSFFLMASLVMLSVALSGDCKSSAALFLWSGLLLSIAATGRQTLVCLSLAPLVLKLLRPAAISSRDALIFFAAALIAPSVLFAIWGGVQPPDLHVAAFRAHGHYSLQHALLGLGYSALYFLLLAPSFFKFTRRLAPLAICCAIAAVLAYAIDMRFMPMTSQVEEHVASATLRGAISLVFPTIIVGLGLFFAFCVAMRVFGDADAFEVLLWIVLAGLVVAAGAVVHQFSSRYIAQGFPIFVLLALLLRDRKKRADQIMPLVGMAIGLASIVGYYR